MSPALTRADAEAFAACIEGGGVAVFPADTVYGLACDPEDAQAVARLYALKGRAPAKPAAVLWFDRGRALAALPQLGPRVRGALEALLPGGVTLLAPNADRRFPLACGPDPDTLGVRVPRLTAALAPLAAIQQSVLQSSANAAGGPDPRTLVEVPPAIRDGADLVLDAGPLPGTPSTVVDLRAYEADGSWTILRGGALAEEEVASRLGIVGGP
jgi:L-threonylcarbamoyladenylate synthase